MVGAFVVIAVAVVIQPPDFIACRVITSLGGSVVVVGAIAPMVVPPVIVIVIAAVT